MREFLTVSELAERWSISDQTLRRKIRRGQIAAIHTPGTRSIRIPARFVADHEATFARAISTSPITVSAASTVSTVTTI